LREIAESTVSLDHLKDGLIRAMQKHVEIDEPEEAPELEPSLFGVADPVGAGIEEDATDEEAIDEELDEDMLSVEDEAAEAAVEPEPAAEAEAEADFSTGDVENFEDTP